MKNIKSKKLRNFYKNQNTLIDNMMSNLQSTSEQYHHTEETSQLEQFGVTGSLVLNIILFVLKLFAAVATGSLTIIASAIDSALDLASGYVLYLVHKLISSSDPYKYPQGVKRLEPVGIVIFACIMSLAAVQVVLEGFRVIVEGFLSEPPEIEIGAFGFSVLTVTIVTKVLMYLICKWISQQVNSASVETYGQDHLNDSLTNTVGIVAVIFATLFPTLWFLDALGGILISLWVIYSWSDAAKEQIQHLTGKTADPLLLQHITHRAFCHHTSIEKVDTVRAYHFGEGFLVEVVDIVMDKNTPLQESHDVGEALQIKLEEMEEVERAFVHIDYEWDHSPEH
eukprot:jgi/Bigna1/34339/e_gw1.5.34.1